MIRIKRLPGGKTSTVESFWNSTATAFFRAPAGAKINVKYGVGWASVNSETQTLDGETVKKLSVGIGSIGYARMRVKPLRDADVAYDIYPGNVAISISEQHF
jgi:hypothetical protein